MAESSSSALPGDLEWLPGPGGARLLRIHPPSLEPPVLILRDADGAQTRVLAGGGPHTEYEIPGSLDWETAWLVWPDGSRATIPAPHGADAQVIELRPRRFRPSPAPRGFVRVPAYLPRRPEKRPGASWTTLPQLGDAPEPDDWQERHEAMARELAQASAAIGRAREGERLAREAVLTALAAARADLRAARAARDADASAFAALSGELEAERSAHAVTRGSIGTLADALAAARAELAAAREAASDAQEAVAVARSDAALEVARLRAELESERAARERAEAELQRAVRFAEPVAAGPAELERRAREQAEAAAAAARRPPAEAGRLLADLDAAAAALRAATAPDPDLETPAAHVPSSAAPEPASASRDTATPSSGADAPSVDAVATDAPTPDENQLTKATEELTSSTTSAVRGADAPSDTRTAATGESNAPAGAAATTDDAAIAGEVAAPGDVAPTGSALVTAEADRRLRKALIALSHADAGAAGALLVGLLPAQGAVIEGSLTYDLTVRGIGTFAVFVEDGSARVVRLSGKRPRNQALFHLSGDPTTLAELLAGERTKLSRFRRQGRVTGRRKRARELAPLVQSRLSLVEAVKAGARVEPALVYRALPHVIEPEWTKGHSFTVAQRIVELDPQTWHITARDGFPLRVVEHAGEAAADATVTMSRAAFERLLKDEPQPVGDRPQVRGDRAAVAALKSWTDLARGV